MTCMVKQSNKVVTTYLDLIFAGKIAGHDRILQSFCYVLLIKFGRKFDFNGIFFFRLCICDNGHAKGCKAVLCTPPQACKSFQIGSSCCEFICLDDALTGNVDKQPDFGIWLIASGVTATLSLTLLFLIVNRFRQRKIRVSANRQNNEEAINRTSIGYIGGNYMNNGNIEYPFDPNSNQYNLWKPSSTYFPRGEAPPPYEEAVAQGADTINAQCTVR